MLRTALYKMFRLEDKEVVKWETLELATPLVWTKLTTNVEYLNENLPKDGVYFKRLPTKVSNQLIFITRIYKGFGYHHHTHDCKETSTVLRGSCIVNDSTVLNEDEYIVFHKGALHKVYHHGKEEYMELFVEFNKR